MLSLVKRNVRLYFGDLTSVFLSLLGALIAIGLILLFLKTSIVNSIAGGPITPDEAAHVTDAWLVASASVIAGATTGLAGLAQFVRDKESRRWRDFLVAPLARWAITSGYLLAAVIVSAIMTTIVYTIGVTYCLINSVPLSFSTIAASWGLIMLSALGFTGLMGFVVSLLNTEAAFTGLSVIVGVTFGFLSETYVSRSVLSDGAARVLSWLPFAQSASLVRGSFTSEAVAVFPELARQTIVDSLALTPGSLGLTGGAIACVLIAMAIVFSVLAWRTMARAVSR